MRITRIHIKNFRSIHDLKMELGDVTVLIGQNNAGKTAILDAVRIVLTRRWGQRGTGFTENDVHRPNPEDNPRTLPPVEITLTMEESQQGEWNSDMVAVLDDVITLLSDGRSILTVRVTCAWSEEKESFDPVWQFLNADGGLLPARRRSINLIRFFDYLPLFWLSPLRDALHEFAPQRSGHWGRLLRSVHIPDELEKEVTQILEDLDQRIIAADPKLSEIAGTISQATQVAIGEKPGAARLNTLPLHMEDMLQRTGIVMRNEGKHPWFPLDRHGQGLQSLAVIFLFQAVVSQQMAEGEFPGAEPVFAIEEPEAHLHPQAARALWPHVERLSGQKIMATHSPYFVQHVPLRDLRVVRLRNGRTEVSLLPSHFVSELPWNEKLDALVAKTSTQVFFKDALTGRVAARSHFDRGAEKRLLACCPTDSGNDKWKQDTALFRHKCRVLLTDEDERKLDAQGRRTRGENFFARHWILVEGPTEYLFVHALAKGLGWPLDTHGVAVIDFKHGDVNAGIYLALAEAFDIPWHMIVDGDLEGTKIKDAILKRGFGEEDLEEKLEMLPDSCNFEGQLIADGHEKLLREILAEMGKTPDSMDSAEKLAKQLDANKVAYISALSWYIAQNKDLAQRMPVPFVNLVTKLRDSGA